MIKVNLKDTSTNTDKPSSQKNARNSIVECKSDTTSDGKDSFTFICDVNLAATEVIIKSTSGTALAEVVIAGKSWRELINLYFVYRFQFIVIKILQFI